MQAPRLIILLSLATLTVLGPAYYFQNKTAPRKKANFTHVLNVSLKSYLPPFTGDIVEGPLLIQIKEKGVYAIQDQEMPFLKLMDLLQKVARSMPIDDREFVIQVDPDVPLQTFVDFLDGMTKVSEEVTTESISRFGVPGHQITLISRQKPLDPPPPPVPRTSIAPRVHFRREKPINQVPLT